MNPNEPTTADKEKTPEEIASADSDAALAGWLEEQDAKNLVPFFVGVDDFGPKWLDKLAQSVIDDQSSAWDGSEEYREKRKANYAILTGNLPKKTFPWDGCANAHMPVMLERHLRLTSNVYVELFTDREVIFNVQPTGPDDMEEAEILTLHGNWQLKNDLTDFSRQQMRGVGEFFASGSVFAHSYRDTVKNRNRHDVLNCEELQIPFVWTTVETDMSDVPFKIRAIRKYRNEVESLGAPDGEWAQTEKLLKKGPPSWDILETKVREKAAEGEGIRAPEQNKRAPWVLFEWHGWYKMPGETRDRPMCATVDLHSKTVVKLYVREENDWRDEMRFQRQTQEFDLHQQALQQHALDMQAHDQAMAEHQQIAQQEALLRQAVESPDVDPEEGAMVAQALDAEPMEAPQPPEAPVPPVWLKEGMAGPDPIRRVPIEMFSHGVCFENPNGSLGLGPGSILADLNRLNDEALNRFYDSATLANIWSLIVPEGLDLGSTSVPMAPGKVIRVKNFSGNAIKEAIHELKAGPANPQLMEIVRLVGENADSSVAAPGVMSGEPGKSGETFRGISLRDQRATRQLSQAGLMYCDFLGNILKNNARLNALFMPEDELIQVGDHFAEARKLTLDATGQPQPELRLTRDMYRRDYKVTFTADLRFSSQEEKISRLDEVIALLMQMPPLQGNNGFVYATLVKWLRVRGLAELIPMLGPPPSPQMVPFGTPPPPPPGSAPPGMEGGGPPGAGPPQGEPRPAPGGPQ